MYCAFSKPVIRIMHIGHYLFAVKDDHKSLMDKVVQAPAFRRFRKENAAVLRHAEHPFHNGKVFGSGEHLRGRRFRIGPGVE